LITGASRGFGRAVASALAERGWSLVIDGRSGDALKATLGQLLDAGATAVIAHTGDVADPRHREQLAASVQGQALDLLVNNASRLGPSPQPRLADYAHHEWRQVYEVNVLAPLALTQILLPALRSSSAVVVNLSSDAAVAPYEGWGGYGSSKAALDQWSAILASEEPDLRVYAFDPGDMRTQMHQEAFPTEDISDRPEPETVVPALLRLLAKRPVSGRYQASRWLVQGAVA
nr:SDR family NAD(P)-dependent oxidoreductase [Nocardioidaceae bacterium]